MSDQIEKIIKRHETDEARYCIFDARLMPKTDYRLWPDGYPRPQAHIDRGILLDELLGTVTPPSR